MVNRLRDVTVPPNVTVPAEAINPSLSAYPSLYSVHRRGVNIQALALFLLESPS